MIHWGTGNDTLKRILTETEIENEVKTYGFLGPVRLIAVVVCGLCLIGSGPATAAGIANASSPGKLQPVQDIVINVNLQRNRLTLVIDGSAMKSYPIALGKPQTPTPVGEWKVINKYKNWGKGFGTRWIGLNVPWGIYGIHGTNRPHSIGGDASHGCIRMLNRHVEELYELVPIGAKVIIVGHPLGEAHMMPRRLAKGDRGADVLLIQYQLRSAGLYKGRCHGIFDGATETALKAFEREKGLPVDGVVGHRDYQELGLLE
jgi:hypothetical protein